MMEMKYSKDYKKTRVDSQVINLLEEEQYKGWDHRSSQPRSRLRRQYDPVDQNPFTATSVYDRLNQVKFDSDDSNNPGVWSGIDQINSYISHAIKTSTNDDELAYYIAPTNFGFDSIEGVQDIAKHICRRDVVPNSFYGSKESLDKPFIVISNTTTVLAKSSTDVNQQGGIHWISWVLLPKNYASLSGKQIDNDKHQVLFFDSLGQRSFPEELKKFLTEGGEITEKTDTGEKKVRLMPFCRKEEIDFQDLRRLTGQQINGSDCGWWATYYALMSVYTGGVEFLQKLRGKKLSAKPLRREMNLQEVDRPSYREQKTCKREPISIFQRISKEKDQQEKQFLEGLLKRFRDYCPDELKMGAAVSLGDCFFDSLAQGLNELSDKGLISSDDGTRFSVKSLRKDCVNDASRYRDKIIKDAEDYFVSQKNVAFPHLGNIKDEKGKDVPDVQETFDKYLDSIKKTAEEGDYPLWGRPDIEGRMISDRHDVVLYYYSMEDGQKITVNKITPLNDDSEVLIEGESNNQLQFSANEKAVRIVGYRSHFVPLLSKLEREIQEVIEVSEQEVYGREEHKQSSPDIFVGKEQELGVLRDVLQFSGGKVVTSQVEAFNKFGLFSPREPSRLFTGRCQELHKLHDALYFSSKILTILSGLDGVGKSELARKYIQKYGESCYDGNAMWIDAKSIDDPAALLKKLAKDELKISGYSMKESIESTIKGLCEYFSSKGEKSLFVFDCAEPSGSLLLILGVFCSLSIPRVYVLITSRNRRWQVFGNSFILDQLCLKDAMDLIKKGLCIECNSQDDQTAKLAKELGCFPVALRQAIDYIQYKKDGVKTKNFTISDYLEKYSRNAEELLRFSSSSESGYNKTISQLPTIVYEVCNNSRHFQHESDGKMLLFMCYILPDKVKIQILRDFYHFVRRGSDDDVSLSFDRAIQFLIDHSIVVLQEVGILSIHKLLQKVIKLDLKCHKNKENLSFVESIIRNIINFFNVQIGSVSNKLEDDAKKKDLLPHCDEFLSNIDLFSQKMEQSVSNLLALMSKEYEYIRDHRKREILLKNSFCFHLRSSLESSFQIFNLQVELSVTYLYLRNYNKMIRKLKNAISNLESNCNNLLIWKNDRDKFSLAVLYLCYVANSCGDYEEKATYLKRILDVQLLLHLQTNMVSYSEIAVTTLYLSASYGYLDQEQRKMRMLNLAERGLLAFAKRMTENNQVTSDVFVGISHGYCILNDFDNQIKWLYKALSLKNHSRYLCIPMISVNLGVAFCYSGNFGNAVKYIKNGLEFLAKHYDADHCELAQTRLILALACQCGHFPIQVQDNLLSKAAEILASPSMGQNACHDIVINAFLNMSRGSGIREKEFLLQALSLQQKYYDSDDIRIAYTFVRLASLPSFGNSAERRQYLHRALQIAVLHYEKEDIKTFRLLLILASCYGLEGNFKLQEKLLQAAYITFSQHSSPLCFPCLSSADAVSDIGSLNEFLGKHEKRLKILEKALHIQKHIYPKYHFQLARTQVYVAQSYSFLGKYQHAQLLLKKAIPVLERKCKVDSVRSAIILLDLADAYLFLGLFSLSISSLSRALCIQGVLNINPGCAEPTSVRVYLQAASLYGYLGNFDEQNKLLSLALAIQRECYASYHSQIASTLKELSYCVGRLCSFDKKVAFLEEALEIERKLYGLNSLEARFAEAELNCALVSAGQVNKKPFLESLSAIASIKGTNNCVASFLLFRLGNLYMSLGDFKQSVNSLKKSSKLYEKACQCCCVSISRLRFIDTLMALSRAYGYSGDNLHQKDNLKRALKLQENYYGPEHFVVLVTLVNLAIAYRIIGNNERESLYLREVMVRLLASQFAFAFLVSIDKGKFLYLPEKLFAPRGGFSFFKDVLKLVDSQKVFYDDLLREFDCLINTIRTQENPSYSKERQAENGVEIALFSLVEEITSFRESICTEVDGNREEKSFPFKDHSFYGKFLEKVEALCSSVSRIANEVQKVSSAKMEDIQPTSSFALVPVSNLRNTSIEGVFIKRPSFGWNMEAGHII